MSPPLKQYRPKDNAELLAWVLDVERVTKQPERAEFRYLTARMPIDVKVSAIDRPLGVRVVRARNRTTDAVESGSRIRWKWGRTTIHVEDIDVSSATDEYDVTIEIEMG